MIYAWRRHLAAAAARMEALGAADAELLSTTMTVGFADMSRFSALSNELDDVSLGALVENFENRCTDVVTGHGGRVIKALGDATLFVNADARSATDTALDLIDSVGSQEEMPAIRVGLATGSVLSRLGDISARRSTWPPGSPRRPEQPSDRRPSHRRGTRPGRVRLPPHAGATPARIRRGHPHHHQPSTRVPLP